MSITEFCVYIFECHVSWKSHGQKTVVLSSSATKAKYIVILELYTEILFIKSILEFLNIKIKLPIIVHCDNIGAIYLGHNAKLLKRMKHIDMKHRFVREYIVKGTFTNCVCEIRRSDADI